MHETILEVKVKPCIQAANLDQTGTHSMFDNFVYVKALNKQERKQMLQAANSELLSKAMDKGFNKLKYLEFNSVLKFDVWT